MLPRIAIPLPHFSDHEYAERAISQYERAVELAGGQAVRVVLDQTADEIRKVMEQCDGVLLPGSKADVDPARFHATRSAHTAAADPRRDAVDDLLLENAYRDRKPVLGICYGLQSLNVYRAGSLIQHIPDFLPEKARAKVDHEAGRKVAVAHSVDIEQVPGWRKSWMASRTGTACGAGELFASSSRGEDWGRIARCRALHRGRHYRGAGRNRARSLCAGGAVASGTVGG